MRVYFSPEEEFAERFQRTLGSWLRVYEKVGVTILAVGAAIGVGALWDDYERLPVILLLTAIGLFIYLCYVLLMGILTELAYHNERSAKSSQSTSVESPNSDND